MRTRLAIAGACAGLLAAIWTVTLERIDFEREDEAQDEVRQNANLAVAFEEQTVRVIRDADKALLYLKRRYERTGQVGDASELADIDLQDDAIVANYLVTDANGSVLRNGGTPGSINVSDRDFFQFHRTKSDGRPFIAKPVTGRLTGRPLISLSRRLDNLDGSFRGVIAVGLDPAYFLRTYRTLDLGLRGVIQLVGLDGVARARRLGDEETFGADMSGSILLKEATARPTGNFVSRGTAGVRRFISYRVLHEYDLIVAVGTAEEDALAQVRRREANYYFGAGVATVLVFLLAAGVLLGAARRARDEAQRRAMEARYSATFDHAPLGIVHAAPDGTLLKVNPRHCDIMGYSEAEMVGRNFIEFTHADDREKAASALRRYMESSTATRDAMEKRSVRKDGPMIWLALTGALVRDERGKPDYLVVMVQDTTVEKEAEARLLQQLDELRRFQRVTVGRELRMAELQDEIRSLRQAACS